MTATYPPHHHRTVLFYGDDGFARIRAAKVTIVGLGGVGGHAAVNLARSGIGGLRLVDFDTVTASSLNRSPFARPADLGLNKAAVLKAHLAEIGPDTTVSTDEAFCNTDTLPRLVPAGEGRPDLVLDAIDSLQPKVELLVWCYEQGIPVLTSMGAAGKRDVGQVRTGDISETRICALARFVRRRLKRRGITTGIPAIWSLEQGDADRPDAPRETDDAPVPPDPNGGRERHTLASQMTLPGVFGYGLAALALDAIAEGSSAE